MDSVNEQLAQLNALYRSQLPAKIQELDTARRQLQPANWSHADADTLYRLLHALTGSAGTFGFPELSQVSRVTELSFAAFFKSDRAPSAQEWQQFSAEFSRLQAQLQASLAAGQAN